MSDETQDIAYWDRADEIINLANQQTEDAASDDVNSSLLYATARFNAFLVAASAENADEIKAGKAAAIEFFTEQYRQLLSDNIDDYIENFDEYNA
jgi:predicted aminopeptidase